MRPEVFIAELLPPGTPDRLRMGDLRDRFEAVGVKLDYKTLHGMIRDKILPQPLRLTSRLYLFDTEEVRSVLAKTLPTMGSLPAAKTEAK